MFEVTLWPILAGILNVVLGMIWYHPKVFGTAGWQVREYAGESGGREEKMPIMAFWRSSRRWSSHT